MNLPIHFAYYLIQGAGVGIFISLTLSFWVAFGKHLSHGIAPISKPFLENGCELIEGFNNTFNVQTAYTLVKYVSCFS